MDTITQEYVKELFDYNEDSGILTWKVRKSKRIRVGDEVGYVVKNDGYRRTRIDETPYFAHRIIWLWMTGSWPDSHIDHINGIRDDNRWSNLREATVSQNGMNRGKQTNNASGYKNIHYYKDKRKVGYSYWRVKIEYQKEVHTKCFPYTDEGLHQAILHRDEMLHKLHGEFARQD